MPINVLITDDQPLIRAGFRMVLEEQGDICVIGEASDGDEAVRLSLQLHPDVVLTDVRMPGTDGIDATRLIIEQWPAAKVLVLTTFDVDEYVFSALRHGASGFLLKDARPADLVDAIRAVASGDAVVAPSATRRLLDAVAGHLPDGRSGPAAAVPELERLTDREREVLGLVAEGLSNTEIAAALFISEATVKSHVGRVLSKLGLRDRVPAVVFAYQVGLVPPPRP